MQWKELIKYSKEAIMAKVIKWNAEKDNGPRSMTVNSSRVIPSHMELILIDASKNPVQITLNDPKKANWVSLVVVDNTFEITVDGIIFDKTNIDLNNKGDAISFLSNDDNMWYCLGKYFSHFGY